MPQPTRWGDNATHTILHLASVTEHRGPAKLLGRKTRKDGAPSYKELMAQQANTAVQMVIPGGG